MIALFIIGYLVVGILVARICNWIEPFDPDDASAFVFLWPLLVFVIAIIGAGIGAGILAAHAAGVRRR